MVTQQEKKMLWEYFGKGSGVEIREVAQTREIRTPECGARICSGERIGCKRLEIQQAGLASGLPLPK